jgi:hypothetical protein
MSGTRIIQTIETVFRHIKAYREAREILKLVLAGESKKSLYSKTKDFFAQYPEEELERHSA